MKKEFIIFLAVGFLNVLLLFSIIIILRGIPNKRYWAEVRNQDAEVYGAIINNQKAIYNALKPVESVIGQPAQP